MQNFTIIISTIINTQEDLLVVKQVIQNFPSIKEWSQDLDDCDKVLRVVSEQNIATELVEELNTLGVVAKVMEIFEKESKEVKTLFILWSSLLNKA